ncbi:MAG: SiaC family regulatory phosphoprotein [Cyclobacteriaceae bacterium]
MNNSTHNTTSYLHPAPVAKAPISRPPLKIRYVENHNFILIKGWSLAQENVKRYQYLLENIRYHLDEHDTLTIHFAYQLFNATTAKFLFNTIKLFNKALIKGKNVKCIWYVKEDDNEMFETGIDLRAMCDFQFKISLY